MALGEDHVEAVGERRALERRERHARARRGLRHASGAVHALARGGELGARVGHQRVAARRHPPPRGVEDGLWRGGQDVGEVLAVGVGAAEVDVALGQHVALAAEAADALDAADEAGARGGLDAVELRLRGALLQEPRELLVDGGLDRREVAAGAGRGDDVELAADLAAGDVRGDVRGDLVAVDEALVEPRGLAVREHVGGDGEEVVVRRADLGDVPHALDPGLRDAVLGDLAAVGVHRRHPPLEGGHGRAGLDVAEVALDLLQRDLWRDVARDDEDGVVGAVVAAEPVLHVLQRGRVEVVHRADDGVVVGVALRVRRVVDELAGGAVGGVLALPLLVLHDPALLVQLALVDGAEEVAHPVALHEEGGVERAHGDVLEVVRAVLVGRPVEVGRADAFEDLEVVVVEVLRAVEHQVLEEVGEPAPPGGLVLGADVVPHVDGYDGRLVVLVDDEGEPVVEGERLVRDVGDAGEGAALRARQRREDESEDGEGDGSHGEKERRG